MHNNLGKFFRIVVKQAI